MSDGVNIAERRTRMDGYAQVLNAVRITKRSSTSTFIDVEPLLESEAEALYASDYVAAKMVDMIAEDMVREGFELIIPEVPEEDRRKIIEYLEYNLNWKQKFQDAISWARLYGGSAILLGVDDGSASLAEELNYKNIRRFDYMTLFHNHELRYHDLQKDPSKSGYGLPISYVLQQSTRAGIRLVGPDIGTVIHASRLVRFDGCRLPRRAFERNGFWHDSVLSKRKTVLDDYSKAYSAASILVSKISQAVMRMKNLSEIMNAPDGKALLLDRMDMLDQGRSLLNTMLIDQDESWEQQVINLGGIPEALNKFEQRLVTNSEYPHTLLLGEAPGGGIGQTGKSELRDYYDAVSRRQETQLKPQIKMMIKAMFCDKNGPTKGKEPESWDINFLPLWQASQAEVLEQRGKQASIDEIYIRSGVLSPEEVATSRFGSGEYSHETTLVYDRATNVGDDFSVSADTQDNSTAVGSTPTPRTAKAGNAGNSTPARDTASLDDDLASLNR